MQDQAGYADIFHALEGSGLIGLIWVNRDMRVRRVFGDAVRFVVVGGEIADQLPALVGLEAEMAALEHDPSRTIELPAVSNVTASGTGAVRLNYSMRWDRAADCILIVAQRSRTQGEVEIELNKQIRARLIAEAELQQTARELTRANTDLENFATLVSHDLKAPLRHMRHLILSAREAKPDGDQGYLSAALDDILAQSSRMTDMLNALFEYSLIGRKYEMAEIVDVRAVAESAVQQTPRAGFDVRIEGDWPTLTTLRAPLTMVLANLVQNAVEHHDRDSGQVLLSCTDAPDLIAITVADDGPGIEPKNHDAVFQPFRTLTKHNAKSKSGTGMGLAAVKKVVDLMGGEIELLSTPPQHRGTAFIITWPKRLPV